MNLQELSGKTIVVIGAGPTRDASIERLKAMIKAKDVKDVLIISSEDLPEELKNKMPEKTSSEILCRPEPLVLKNYRLEELPDIDYEHENPKKHRGHERPYKYHR